MLRKLGIGLLTVVVLSVAGFCLAMWIWPPIAPDGRALAVTPNLVRSLAFGVVGSAALGGVVWWKAGQRRIAEGRAGLSAVAVASYRKK